MNRKSCQHPKLSNTLLKCRNLKSTDGTVNLSLIVLSLKNHMGKYSKEILPAKKWCKFFLQMKHPLSLHQLDFQIRFWSYTISLIIRYRGIEAILMENHIGSVVISNPYLYFIHRSIYSLFHLTFITPPSPQIPFSNQSETRILFRRQKSTNHNGLYQTGGKFEPIRAEYLCV